MNTKNIRPGKLPDMDEKISSEEVESLRKQMYELQLEVDILKETINVLKKDPRVDWKDLKNREKGAVIAAGGNFAMLLIKYKKKERVA